MRTLLVPLTKEFVPLFIDRDQFLDVHYECPAPESRRGCNPTLSELGHVLTRERAGELEPERRRTVVQVIPQPRGAGLAGHFRILASACPKPSGTVCAGTFVSSSQGT